MKDMEYYTDLFPAAMNPILRMEYEQVIRNADESQIARLNGICDEAILATARMLKKPIKETHAEIEYKTMILMQELNRMRLAGSS